MKSVGLIFLLALIHFSASPQECLSSAYRNELLRQSPELSGKIAAIESFTRNWLSRSQTAINDIQSPNSNDHLIRIPVVVHVLYGSTNQNISDAQVNSQILSLNYDYRRFNADTLKTPDLFKPFAADCGIEFILAGTDPRGNATSGIVRKHTSVYAFNIDDRIKYSAQGGDDAWDPDNYLNIWVGNLSSGILGYSSLPGCAREKDGVVIQWSAFGTTGALMAPFNKGRTATHEIGHWLNLYHTWGDTDCGDDLVADTPPQKGPSRGCPGESLVTCGSGPYGDMYMNYMDFTDDACLNLFTNGQRERMRALFAPGGVRSALLNSNAAAAHSGSDPLKSTPTADMGGQGIRLYPNPAVHMVSVQVDDSLSTPIELGIYNSMGQKLMSVRMNEHIQQINVEKLLSGIYFVRSENSRNKSLVRLLKM